MVSTRPITRATVQAITRGGEAMTHRGPDDQGVWVSPNQHCVLAHRRLAVIDCSAGSHQPMTDGHGNTLVFNGEVYNFHVVRRELEGLGHTFTTTGDSEIVLAAYRQWGTDCVEHLVGMFAIAIVDLSLQRLFIARDRVGEKPVFLYCSQDGLRFASETKALLEDRTIDRRMDLAALDEYLAYGYVPRDRCLLAGFRKLLPAHALTFDLQTGDLREWRYWTLPTAPTAFQPLPELVDRCETLLGEAVSSQLVADVPIGVLLSGGVDSSIIAAIAARHSSAPVHTYTVIFPGHAKYDESAYAREVSSYIGSRHTELVADDVRPTILDTLVRQYDEPIADSSMIPTYLVSRAIRSHATVAIGGDGGDELFGGYPHYNWLLRQQQIRRWVPATVRAMVAYGAARLPLGMRGRNHLVGFRGPLSSGIAHVNVYFDAYARRHMLGSEQRRAGMSKAETRRAAAAEATSVSASVTQMATRTDFHHYLPDDILVKVDRASMLASLEVRAPFLDHRVVEFAFGDVPDHAKVTRDGRKILLRQLSERLLPPTFDARRKQGFSVPLDAWIRGAWRPMFEEILRGIPAELVAPAVIDALLKGQDGGRSNAQRIFALAALERWRCLYQVALP